MRDWNGVNQKKGGGQFLASAAVARAARKLGLATRRRTKKRGRSSKEAKGEVGEVSMGRGGEYKIKGGEGKSGGELFSNDGNWSCWTAEEGTRVRASSKESG